MGVKVTKKASNIEITLVLDNIETAKALFAAVDFVYGQLDTADIVSTNTYEEELMVVRDALSNELDEYVDSADFFRFKAGALSDEDNQYDYNLKQQSVDD